MKKLVLIAIAAISTATAIASSAQAQRSCVCVQTYCDYNGKCQTFCVPCGGKR